MNHTAHTPETNNKAGLAARIFLIFAGAGALLWFLVRVIPKPQRASYPCMQASFPLVSSFVIYMAGLGTSLFTAGKGGIKAGGKRTRHIGTLVGVGLVIACVVILVRLAGGETGEDRPRIPNTPMGEAQGIYPGRVVWVHDPDATNPDCIPDDKDAPWWSTQNSKQEVIDTMLSRGIRELTGCADDASAWTAIFRFHNRALDAEDQGYRAGEKVFIKTNATSSWYQNIDFDTLEHITWSAYFGMSETSPQVILALLRQLVHEAGVPQEDIYVGDPMKHIYQSHYRL